MADQEMDPDLATGGDRTGPRPQGDPRYDDRYEDGRRQVKVRRVKLAKVQPARGATRR